MVGRESGKARLEVCHHASRKEIEPKVLAFTLSGTTVYTDELAAYNHLPEYGRFHIAVAHKQGKYSAWAQDLDGDGIREAHSNTAEGFWTSLKNFLRRFRGVHKKYLHLYVAVFEWGWNVKKATVEYLRALLGVVTQFAS